MDVEIGPEDMPVCQKKGLRLAIRCFFWVVVFGTFATVSRAVEPASESMPRAKPARDPLHWTGDKTVWDRKNDRVVVDGNAILRKPRETMNADWMEIDLKARRVHARGNCIFLSKEAVITAGELFFDLDTSTGTILAGRVSNGSFLLMGDRIDRLESDRYVTHRGEYTACRDCPASWAVQGDNVDIEFEGYGYFSNVVGKVKDAPLVWIPWMVVPLKSKRQSGLLFPKMGFAGLDGFRFVPMLYWAPSRNVDVTVGAGTYSARGLRVETEARVVFSPQSGFEARWNMTHDVLQFAGGLRWNAFLRQTQAFPLGIREQLDVNEVSDHLIPGLFPDDLVGRGEPVLASSLLLRQQSALGDLSLGFWRYRNILSLTSLQAFDSKTVQASPMAEWGLSQRWIGDLPISIGWTLGWTQYARTASYFDTDYGSAATSYTEGVDPLRQATRVAFKPVLSTSFRPWDAFTVMPSLQYFGYAYGFPSPIASLYRGYVLFQTEVSWQLEKIFETEDPAAPRLRHVIRPKLVYSRIPFSHRPDTHPFISQIDYRSVYAFDNEDFFPFTRSQSLVNYTVPQGNSLTYGVVTQLSRRTAPAEALVPTYARVFEVSVGQSIDFWPSATVPLSRLFAFGDMAVQDYTMSLQYYFYPYLDRYTTFVTDPSPHEISVSLGWTMGRRLGRWNQELERNLSLTYAWSRINTITSIVTGRWVYALNDAWKPATRISYDFHNRRFIDARGELIYNSPSQCWSLATSLGWALDRGQFFDVNLNILPLGPGSSIAQVAAR